MFKKLLIVALVLAFTAAPVFALEDFQFDKSKVSIGVEYSIEDKDIDTPVLADIQLGNFLGGTLTTTLKDFEVQTELLKLGYELSESATPYLLVGLAQIDMKQQLNGAIQLGKFNGGTTLMQTDMNEGDIAYGVGIGGDVAQYKGIVLSYDARYWTTSVDGSGNNLSILPDFTSIKLNNNVDVDYNELDLALILSKTIDMTDAEGNAKIVQSLTPSIGYRYSQSNVNVENKTSIGPLAMESETNYRSYNHDALIGLEAQINDQVSAKVAGIVGDNKGVMVSVGYKF